KRWSPKEILRCAQDDAGLTLRQFVQEALGGGAFESAAGLFVVGEVEVLEPEGAFVADSVEDRLAERLHARFLVGWEIIHPRRVLGVGDGDTTRRPLANGGA